MTTIAARSDARGLRQLALHLCALAATGICLNLALGSLWSAPALVLHGVVLVFLFAAEHESIHRTAFRSRWLNDVVASLCGLAITATRRTPRAIPSWPWRSRARSRPTRGRSQGCRTRTSGSRRRCDMRAGA
jgi:fatty acid desaturase